MQNHAHNYNYILYDTCTLYVVLICAFFFVEKRFVLLFCTLGISKNNLKIYKLY